MDERLTISAVLANAVALDGQIVSVVGFFICVREEVAIYGTAAHDRTPAEAIWLVHPATVHGEERTKRLARQWVQVVGTFHNRSKSKHQGFPATMSGITVLELAEYPP